MAIDMKIKKLREILKDPQKIIEHEFDVVKELAIVASTPGKADEARDLVLRALEHSRSFSKTRIVLDSVIRSVGLFPYIDPEQLGLKDRIAYEFHRPLKMDDDFVFHREQAEIYRRLLAGESVILSAPTSFGKSRIIDALIAVEKFDNIAVIVPTLALIDETRRRFAQFSDRYKIVSHLSQKPAKKNIFVFTAERAIAYDEFPEVQFFVIDEFYKINALAENNTRTVALNIAFQRFLKMGGQFYLLGPNIDRIPEGLEAKYRCYFYPTNFSTVASEQHQVSQSSDDFDRLTELCRSLDDPTLIFCRSPKRANDIARRLLEEGIGINAEELNDAKAWAAEHYHPDWIWGNALINGIGIHHGKLPRALAQYTVRMFNDLKLRFLICTSTLIEGVNTKAKNVIIFDNTIAMQPFDFFTFNNIKGRSGRMFEHFIGHVYLFSAPPQPKLPFVDFPLFTQDDTAPDSLLVQLEEQDLRPSAQERMHTWIDQTVLPIEIIRENSTIDPTAQIRLANKLNDDWEKDLRLLVWDQIPSYPQLKFACELIWNYLRNSRQGQSGVFTASMLTYKLNKLRQTPNSYDRVQLELNDDRGADNPDDAVESVLQFERNWAGFKFPRYLMALSRIQAHVLTSLGQHPGDYSYYATQVECLFKNSVISSLDEYGIPYQTADRIKEIFGTEDNLDIALAALRGVDISSLRLHPFETELLVDAQHSL